MPETHAFQKNNPSKTRKASSFGANLLKHIVLIFTSLIVLFPIYFMVITAVKTRQGYALNKFDFPNPVTLENFDMAFRNGRFFLWFGNTVLLSLGAVLLSTVIAALAAYAFAKMRFYGQNLIQVFNNALMVIPPVVMIVPMFILLTRLKLIGTYPGGILIYAGLVTPLSIYMLTNFFRSIPQEIIESALIDGATTFQILSKIIIPLSYPALVTLIIVNTLWVWNDLLTALVLLNRDELRTLMVGITVFGTRYNSDVPISMAGMLLASLPMLNLYLFGQRYFVRGLTVGAIKG
jgi:ABC-type glycerol-3-phosphate transport system permease component